MVILGLASIALNEVERWLLTLAFFGHTEFFLYKFINQAALDGREDLPALLTSAEVLRFATLGAQSYHHDEIVTASRILRGSFGHAMDAVGFGESTPPLYYALAWGWTQVTGTGEWGLRSLSAVAGVQKTR